MIPLFMFQTPLFRRKGPKPHSLQSLRPRGALQQIVLYGIFFCFQPLPGKNVPKQRQARTASPRGAAQSGRRSYCWPVGCWLVFGVSLPDLVTLGLLRAVPPRSCAVWNSSVWLWWLWLNRRRNSSRRGIFTHSEGKTVIVRGHFLLTAQKICDTLLVSHGSPSLTLNSQADRHSSGGAGPPVPGIGFQRAILALLDSGHILCSGAPSSKSSWSDRAWSSFVVKMDMVFSSFWLLGRSYHPSMSRPAPAMRRDHRIPARSKRHTSQRRPPAPPPEPDRTAPAAGTLLKGKGAARRCSSPPLR